MTKYVYKCEGCEEWIPEMRLHNDEGFVHHIVGEKEPYPCGPVKKYIEIVNPPKPGGEGIKYLDDYGGHA